MKTKKIVALLVANVMLFASVAVSAATISEQYGWQIVDAYPTVLEINERTPSVSVSVEPISFDAAKAAGISGGPPFAPLTEADRDCYKATYTVTGLGDLYYAVVNDNQWTNYAWVKLFDVTITIPTFTESGHVVCSGSLNGTNFTNAALTKLIWNPGSADQSKLYPAGTPQEGIYDGDLVLEAEVIYALAEGATVNVTPSLSVTYDVKTADGNPSPTISGTAANSLMMAPAAPATTYTIAFKDYDGSNLQSNEYNENDTVTAPTATRSGYTFSHWSETQGGAAATVLTTATADKTYYAVYTKDPVITDSSIDVKKPISGTIGLKDLQGQDVTLTKNYGIAKFSKAIDTNANNYFLAVEAENGEKDDLAIDFDLKGVEISGASTTFFAIVRSSTRVIKSIQLKEVAK